MRDIILTAKTLKRLLERHKKDISESLFVLKNNLDDADTVEAIEKYIEKLLREWEGIYSLYCFCLRYEAVVVIEDCRRSWVWRW